jgi:putative addiction module antidote
MTQKLLKVGDSAAVTIPKRSLEELGLKVGDSINVEVDKKKRMVFIEPADKKVDKEFLDWTRKFIERYKPALEALSKK